MAKLIAKFCNLMVSKEIMHDTQVSCFTHEIPIFVLKYPGKVRLCEKQPTGKNSTRQLASVGGEYNRLAAKHGVGIETLAVEEIYGNRMVGNLKEHIGRAASEYPLVDENEEQEYDDFNQAPEAEEESGDEQRPDEPEQWPTGEPNKTQLVAFLEKKGIEYDQDASKDDLTLWAESAFPAFIAAAEPGRNIPDDLGLNGLMAMYDYVTTT